ncbi:putative ribonuclease H protein [Senna tora]|uniref:Putative ribonuclease H protein n=1 Tax=Senna tora TaxID=362788 RepID=A0A834XCW7_9FABA|nr:putative ribonuclease H protein [Senna tora]
MHQTRHRSASNIRNHKIAQFRRRSSKDIPDPTTTHTHISQEVSTKISLTPSVLDTKLIEPPQQTADLAEQAAELRTRDIHMNDAINQSFRITLQHNAPTVEILSKPKSLKRTPTLRFQDRAPTKSPDNTSNPSPMLISNNGTTTSRPNGKLDSPIGVHFDPPRIGLLPTDKDLLRPARPIRAAKDVRHISNLGQEALDDDSRGRDAAMITIVKIPISPLPKLPNADSPTLSLVPSLIHTKVIREVALNPIPQPSLQEIHEKARLNQVPPKGHRMSTVPEDVEAILRDTLTRMARARATIPLTAIASSKKLIMHHLPHKEANPLGHINPPNALPGPSTSVDRAHAVSSPTTRRRNFREQPPNLSIRQESTKPPNVPRAIRTTELSNRELTSLLINLHKRRTTKRRITTTPNVTPKQSEPTIIDAPALPFLNFRPNPVNLLPKNRVKIHSTNTSAPIITPTILALKHLAAEVVRLVFDLPPHLHDESLIFGKRLTPNPPKSRGKHIVFQLME